MAKGWYYLKMCPLCSRVLEIIADAGVSPDSPGPRFYVKCPGCNRETELTGKDLRKLK